MEVHDWEGIIVELEEPGWFTIEVLGFNTLGAGIGIISIWGWNIWTVGDPPEPFEIVLCEPDQTLYTGGQDAAAIAVTVVSNWGESNGLQLDLRLQSSLGQVFAVPGPSFSLGIGDEYSTELTWDVPPTSTPVAYGITVELSDDGESSLESGGRSEEDE